MKMTSLSETTRLEEIIRRALMLVVVATALLTLARVEVLARTQEDESAQQVQTGPDGPAQLQQLVAPIALYPDELIAQILAASTYPTQIVEADRWLQLHSNLQSEQVAEQVDQQAWDPSVKALTAFPSVVANLDKNLSWTTALGEAYFNQQQDVLNAVQVMRQRAQGAGNLQSTPQQRVTTEGTTIVVEPVNPETCYLPVYDPWLIYGAPLPVYPGYIYDPWYGPPYVSFGPAIGIGFFGRFGWGWNAWGFNWGRHAVLFNRSPYISHSRFFYRGFGGNFRGPRFGGGFSGHRSGGFGHPGGRH
jgi:hypothetical protein